jgi:hypothetical protein
VRRVGGRLDDLDRRDLLVEQESGDVHLVDQRVAHDHRAVERRRYRGIAVRAVQHQRSSEFAAVEQCLQPGVLVIEPAHEPHLDQRLAEFGLALDHAERGLDIRCQRLLAQHRLAVLQTGQQLLLVGWSWGGEDDRVDLRIDDGVERVDDGPAAGDARGDLFGLLRDVVVDDGDTRAADPAADAGDVIGAHDADAEYGNAQF